MLAGMLSKCGDALQNRVLRRVLAKLFFLLFSFIDTCVGTLASTPQSTPILESTAASILRSYFGVSHFPPVSQARKFPMLAPSPRTSSNTLQTWDSNQATLKPHRSKAAQQNQKNRNKQNTEAKLPILQSPAGLQRTLPLAQKRGSR